MTTNSTLTLQGLPQEILRIILSFLSTDDLWVFAASSRAMLTLTAPHLALRDTRWIRFSSMESITEWNKDVDAPTLISLDLPSSLNLGFYFGRMASLSEMDALPSIKLPVQLCRLSLIYMWEQINNRDTMAQCVRMVLKNLSEHHAHSLQSLGLNFECNLSSQASSSPSFITYVPFLYRSTLPPQCPIPSNGYPISPPSPLTPWPPFPSAI